MITLSHVQETGGTRQEKLEAERSAEGCNLELGTAPAIGFALWALAVGHPEPGSCDAA